MVETQAPHPIEEAVTDLRRRIQGCAHVGIVVLTLASIMLYASSVVIQDPAEVLDMIPHEESLIPMMPMPTVHFKHVDASVPKTQVYVHKSLTLPNTNFQLANFAKTLNVEPSRLLNIENNTTLRWNYDDEKAINFMPSLKLYGLTAINAASNNGVQKFTALLRLPKEQCKSNQMSWTCQGDARHKQFDNSYCAVILESATLPELLIAARNVAENERVDMMDPMVKGSYCGNPLLQRIAAGSNSVYMLNKKHDPDNPEFDYLLCKYNTDTKDLSQCIDITLTNANYKKPATIIYDRATDSVLTLHYKDSGSLAIVTFEGQSLGMRILFRPLPSPGGFLVHSESFDGNVVFHGDISLYEVDAVLNLESGQDVTVKPV